MELHHPIIQITFNYRHQIYHCAKVQCLTNKTLTIMLYDATLTDLQVTDTIELIVLKTQDATVDELVIEVAKVRRIIDLDHAHIIELEFNQDVESWKKSIASVISVAPAIPTINPEFRQCVDELQAFFEHIMTWLHISGEVETPLTNQRADEILELFSAPWLDIFNRFEQIAQNFSNPQKQLHKQYMQSKLHPYLLRVPFIHRVFTKPLGYAGDFEMINMILRNAPEGDNHYSQLLHKLNIKPAIPTSVRNRNDIMLEYLKQASAKKADFRVLSLGCGGAYEIQRFMKSHPKAQQAQYHLLDFSQPTLDHVRKEMEQLEQQSNHQYHLEYIQESVLSLVKNAKKGHYSLFEQPFDLVYCAGLFDYLSDKVCQTLLRLFYQWVAKDGLVFITNMHPRNPERQWMDYIFEWELIYRDEESMAKWVPELGQQKIFADDTGVNVFLEIAKID